MGAYSGLSVNLAGYGDPQTLAGARVTSEVFPMPQPVIGHLFNPQDDTDSGPATTVLSFGLWPSALTKSYPVVLG
jgi:hypothetical protein